MTGVATSEWRWPTAGALLAGLLTYLTTATGIALAGFLGALQVGVLVGIVVGLVSPSLRVALAASAAALVAGVVILPPWFQAGQPLTLAVLLGVGIAAAAGSRAIVASGQLRQGMLVAVALALLIGSVWLVATSVAATPTARDGGLTPLQVLATRPVAGQQWTDSEYYRAIVWRMRDGEPFLAALRASYHDNARWGTDPTSALGVRPPLLFELWKSLPTPWAASALWVLLGIVSVAMAVSPAALGDAVPSALGVAGAAGLASYALGFALVPTLLFLSEIWTGVVAVVVLALFATARRPGAARGWMIAAAATALVATFARELMVFLLVAGILAAFFAPRERRTFDLAVWGGSLAIALAAFAVHYSAARRIVTPIASVGFAWAAHGGVRNLLSGLTSATWSTGGSWVPITIALLGIAGAAALPDRQYRAFALAAVCMPLVGFLFVGTDAVLRGSGVAFNYWGAIVVPALFVLAPASLGWIPGMRPASAVPASTHDLTGSNGSPAVTD